MKAGDLMRCTFQCGRSTDLVLLIENRNFDGSFWNILWGGDVMLMHTDHLVPYGRMGQVDRRNGSQMGKQRFVEGAK